MSDLCHSVNGSLGTLPMFCTTRGPVPDAVYETHLFPTEFIDGGWVYLQNVAVFPLLVGMGFVHALPMLITSCSRNRRVS